MRSDKNKFPWFMMLICLDDVKMMLEFFRSQVGTLKGVKGVKVLLERMDDVEALSAENGLNNF